MKNFHAYTVSLDGVVKYVGVTTQRLSTRWRQHRKTGSGCVALVNAIRKHGTKAFTMSHVASARSVRDLQELERDLIAQHNTMSPFGYNLSTGGYNGQYSEETRERMRARWARIDPETRSAMNKGRTASPETRAKIVAALTGKTASIATRAKQSAAQKGRVVSIETRARMSAAGIGRALSPATRAKISAAKTGKTGHVHSPETRARMSAAQKGTTRTPEARARMSAAQKGREHTPETRARMSAAHVGRTATIETRAKQRAATLRFYAEHPDARLGRANAKRYKQNMEK